MLKDHLQHFTFFSQIELLKKSIHTEMEWKWKLKVYFFILHYSVCKPIQFTWRGSSSGESKHECINSRILKRISVFLFSFPGIPTPASLMYAVFFSSTIVKDQRKQLKRLLCTVPMDLIVYSLVWNLCFQFSKNSNSRVLFPIAVYSFVIILVEPWWIFRCVILLRKKDMVMNVRPKLSKYPNRTYYNRLSFMSGIYLVGFGSRVRASILFHYISQTNYFSDKFKVS